MLDLNKAVILQNKLFSSVPALRLQHLVFAANTYLGSKKVVLQTLILFKRSKYPVCLLYLMNTYLFLFFL